MQAIGAGYGAYMPDYPPRPPRDPVGRVRGTVIKAKSTNALRTISTAPAEQEYSSFHTLQDPRTASTSDLSGRGSEDARQSANDSEVTALSDKLISAINHQQQLDDSLAQARHELEVARRRIEELEAREQAQREETERGERSRQTSVAQLTERLTTQLAEANKQKSHAELAKRNMEAELETLTASLFDEANNMVAEANRERDAVERKNQQLRDQIKDEEAVIASQHEQLIELKKLMSLLQTEPRKELTDSPRTSHGPGTPKVEGTESEVARLLEALDLTPVSADAVVSPGPSTTFTHLLRPQCRTDIPAYEDFRHMLPPAGVKSHHASHANSRAGSGSYAHVAAGGPTPVSGGTNASSPNLGAQATFKASQTPPVPGAFSPGDPRGPTALKDTKFFKRLMVEDIEPTLRLDLSPSISWLSRRSIATAFTDSTLIAEPISDQLQKLYGRYAACALCGDQRQADQNPRTHVMRVREGEGATKWPICTLCLEKVRAVGDLVGYVRMVRDGVVKTHEPKEAEEAWEELVRLRERLFWARMAGGVVPAFLPSRRPSPLEPDTAQRPSPSAAPAAVGRATTTTTTTPPRLETPAPTPRTSEDGEAAAEAEEDEITRQANLQLQAGLADVTTFDNAREHAAKSVGAAAQSTPPATPPIQPDRAGSFPKISIPRIPPSFWESQVNTLH